MRSFYSLLFVAAYLLSAQLTGQVAICKANVNVALPADACTVDIDPFWIDAGSYGPSGSSLLYSVDDGTDLGPGTHTVILTVVAYYPSGATGGSNSCWSTVNVEDKIRPDVTCHNQIIYLVDPTQHHVLPIEDMYTATDNCEIASTTISTSDPGPVFGSSPFTVNVEDLSGNSDNCSGTITLADAETQNYCGSTRNAHFEHIANLSLATASNTVSEASGNDGGYFHHLPSGDNILYHGYDYTLSYDPGFAFGAYHEYWSVYLDKNGDGDFTDAGELIHRWNGYGGNSFTFTSPGAYWGWSRIRVVMSYGGYAGPCGGGYGETEDISVFLRPWFIFVWPWFTNPAIEASEYAADIPVDWVKSRHDEAPRANEAIRRITTSLPAPELESIGESSVRVYPNPALAGTAISVSGVNPDLGKSLELRSMSGRLVASFPVTSSQQRLHLSASLPAGMYLLSQRGVAWRRRVLVR